MEEGWDFSTAAAPYPTWKSRPRDLPEVPAAEDRLRVCVWVWVCVNACMRSAWGGWQSVRRVAELTECRPHVHYIRSKLQFVAVFFFFFNPSTELVLQLLDLICDSQLPVLNYIILVFSSSEQTGGVFQTCRAYFLWMFVFICKNKKKNQTWNVFVLFTTWLWCLVIFPRTLNDCQNGMDADTGSLIFGGKIFDATITW